MFYNCLFNRPFQATLSNFSHTLTLVLQLLSALLLLSLVSGCQSTGPVVNPSLTQESKQSISQLDSAQIKMYKNALNLLEQKQYAESKKVLTLLSKELPSFSGTWINLGLIELMEKDPVSAKFFVARAMKLAPNLPEAMNLLGLIATHDRDISLAKGYYLKAIKLDSRYANAHYNLALLYEIYLQDNAKAVVHYQEYLSSTQFEDAITQSWVEQLKSTLSE